jgi:hypothetical protein
MLIVFYFLFFNAGGLILIVLIGRAAREACSSDSEFWENFSAFASPVTLP